MASKPLIIATLVGASIGVPYVASRAKSGSNATVTQPPSMPAATSTANFAPPLFGTSPLTPQGALATVGATPGVSPVPRGPSAEQALQFNVTKDWVYRSWDRKSTGPTDLGLLAVRVPLVSGTQSASLAGSLTYYFNTQDQVEHISFRGRTGDPSRLVRFLMQNYQFQPLSSQPGEQVYQVAGSGGVLSELRTQPAPIVANSTYAAHSVELELGRPGSQRYLPPRGPILNVPQTPDAAPSGQAASTDAGATSSSTAPGSGYLDKIRYATPQEESDAYWRRWPN